MKKLINEPENVVEEMHQGMSRAFLDKIQVDIGNNIVYRRKEKKDKVKLISGGGSGHEPTHGGFVGEGMLDVAVAGEVFASPSVMQVYEAIKEVASNAGVLLIIKNYSGDVMNFEGAADLARDDGIKVETVHVNDDVAIDDPKKRRGVAGTLFVHKIAGALAQRGKDLQAVKAVAEKVIENVRTMGVALKPCTVPAKGEPTFNLSEDEMELGVGIHGEAGVSKENLASAETIAEKIVGKILTELPFEGKSDLALLVNGLGGTPLQELFILNNEVRNILDERDITIHKTIVGNYMTSLDMAGASITMLKLDSEMKELLEAPANTISWKF